MAQFPQDASCVRLCVRKLPPTITESDFKQVPPVRRLIDIGLGSVQFYSAETVGETASPASAFAVVSLDGSQVTQFCNEMQQVQFDHPYSDKKAHAQVEYAPIAVLPAKLAEKPKQMPAIEDDPEFTAFAKEYEASFVPETNSLMSNKDVEDGMILDATRMEDALSSRLGRGDRGRRGGNRNRGRRGGNRRRGGGNE